MECYEENKKKCESVRFSKCRQKKTFANECEQMFR